MRSTRKRVRAVSARKDHVWLCDAGTTKLVVCSISRLTGARACIFCVNCREWLWGRPVTVRDSSCLAAACGSELVIKHECRALLDCHLFPSAQFAPSRLLVPSSQFLDVVLCIDLACTMVRGLALKPKEQGGTSTWAARLLSRVQDPRDTWMQVQVAVALLCMEAVLLLAIILRVPCASLCS